MIHQQIIVYTKEQLLMYQNKKNAVEMAQYMKTTMPFYGVRATERRKIIKTLIEKYPLKTQEEYLQTITVLWDLPHREEKYIAIDIARAYPWYVNSNTLFLFEKMIRKGAWWDLVDDIAVHLVGAVISKHPNTMPAILDSWIQDQNMWIRRTAIICQNKLRGATDQKRLFDFCLKRAHEKDFFIRKAIGWALREYAKTSPDVVKLFLQQHKDSFSPLSYQQATKWLK